MKAVRDKERAWLGMAEQDYKRFVAGWQEHQPAKKKPVLQKGNT